MKGLNSKGQALLESLFALPFAITVVSSLFVGLLSLSSALLADHWTYQSALCLASQQPIAHCKRELKEQLQLLPFYKYEIQKMERQPRHAEVMILLAGPLMPRKIFSEKLRLPLQSQDFRGVL